MSECPVPVSPFVLGIDPGVTTGLAGYCPGSAGDRGELAFVTSAGPLPALRLITAWHRSGVLAAACIKDARRLPIYARHGKANRGQRDRIARNVGRVDCLTTLYLDLLRSLSVPVSCVEPIRAAKGLSEKGRGRAAV